MTLTVRHNSSQFHGIAVEILPGLEPVAKQRRGQHKDTAPRRKATLSAKVHEVGTGEDAEEASKLFGVSAWHVQTAKSLKRKHRKKFKAVKEGKKTLSRAKKEGDREERKALAKKVAAKVADFSDFKIDCV